MPTRKTLLSCWLVVAAGLLAATAAMAADALPNQCTTTDGLWQISTTGPSSTATGMKIEYQVTALSPNTGNPDHVATLAGTVNKADVIFPSASQVYDPCLGDPVSLLGLLSCHEVAAKINAVNNVTAPKIEVAGATPILTSVAVKKGTKGKVSSCAIVGLGRIASGQADACVPSCGGFHPEQTIKTTEILKFKGCSVKFEFDSATGEVLGDPVLVDSPGSCQLHIHDVGDLEITLSGVGPLGLGQFGDGYISTGNNSCTTRVIGGRVYSWGDPCPE